MKGMMMGKGCLGNERGAALITGLVMLLVLTLLGIASMQSTTLQERMAGNLEQKEMAFQAAEAGLRDAEAWLNVTVVLPAFDNTGGLYQPAAAADNERPRWQTVDWSIASQRREYQASDLGTTPPYPLPLYIIEYMGELTLEEADSVRLAPDLDDRQGAYRITSRGVAHGGRGEVILQATFFR